MHLGWLRDVVSVMGFGVSVQHGGQPTFRTLSRGSGWDAASLSNPRLAWNGPGNMHCFCIDAMHCLESDACPSRCNLIKTRRNMGFIVSWELYSLS